MSTFMEFIESETRLSNVVSECHDVSKIDWVRGLSDPGEMISCGYMPQARRRANESDEVYAHRLRNELTPAQYAELAAVAAPAAIRRAGLDTSNGRVSCMVAGLPPWHRLGVNVAQAVDSLEAQQLAGLNWTVSKRPLHFRHANEFIEQSDTFGIVRDDTGKCLGVVGSRYAPIQNTEGFAFLDDVLSSFGAKYESAGAIHGGKQVWMLANLPQSCFSVARGDAVKTYAIFTNPHDGSGRAFCYPTTERVVCSNTFRVSTSDRSKGIGIRHTGSVKSKIDDAKRALCASVKGFADFQQKADALARARVPHANSYFNAVLDNTLPVSADDVRKGAAGIARERCKADVSPEDFSYAVRTAEKEIKSRGEILHDIIERYHGERCRANGIEGTVWSALNAVTEHADYAKSKRKVGTRNEQDSRRFDSVLSGDADEMKQVAFTQALQLIR